MILLFACAEPGSPARREAEAGAVADDTATATTPCGEMALVGEVCVDRHEASIVGWSPYEVPSEGVARSVPAVVPQAYVSGEVAAAACEAAGKRLCTLEEWMGACRFAYPYGDTYEPGSCNDTYDGGHPVVDYFGTSEGVWDTEHMNDPGINQQEGTVDPTGANARCVSPEGVYDLHGNLHEWIADADGTFKGGFYADGSINGEGCAYTTTAHDFAYHDYSTGFRCCADP
ncbi:MAG: SUMF1/EgtB/PvdO family nonheme iron enzyme [Myxococcota bacterium]